MAAQKRAAATPHQNRLSLMSGLVAMGGIFSSPLVLRSLDMGGLSDGLHSGELAGGLV